MAVKTKKKGKKKAAVDKTLWDVILSYPDLYDPKPFKGNIRYRTDVLMDKDHPQLGELRAAIKKVKTEAWGPDKSEWPEPTSNAGNRPLLFDGNEREDQKGYKDRMYITPSTQTPVPVIGPNGKEFNPQMVKGGMFGNVAIRISAWDRDGDEGVSIYLQGVQIDTKKPSLNFGGGKSVKQMFSQDEEDESDSNDENSEDEDEDDQPRSKKKKTKPSSDDEDEDSSESDDSDDSEDEEEPSPKKKKKRNFDEDDDGDEE